jgi:hypothetical protein
VSQSNSSLTGRFNAELKGKTLVIYEELKCSNSNEWRLMNSALKMYTTNETISVEAKSKDAINIDNFISLIIISNDSPIRLSAFDRRYIMTDVSTQYLNNVDYFYTLFSYMKNEDIQKAFYFYCLEYANLNEFDEQAELWKIETEAKAETIIKNLNPLYKFIKEQYVLKKKHMDIFLKDLTQDFNIVEGKSNLSNIEISRIMKEGGMEGKTSTGNKFRFNYRFETLLAIYKKNKWINELEINEGSSDIVTCENGGKSEALRNALLKIEDQETLIQKQSNVIDDQANIIEQLKREIEQLRAHKEHEQEIQPEIKITTKENNKIICPPKTKAIKHKIEEVKKQLDDEPVFKDKKRPNKEKKKERPIDKLPKDMVESYKTSLCNLVGNDLFDD